MQLVRDRKYTILRTPGIKFFPSKLMKTPKSVTTNKYVYADRYYLAPKSVK